MFYCQLRSDRACFVKISIAGISGELDEKAGASRRVDGAIFLYRGTIVNELSSRKEVFTIENPPLRKFVSRIYDLYQRAESNHVPSKVVGHKSEVNCARQARNRITMDILLFLLGLCMPIINKTRTVLNVCTKS